MANQSWWSRFWGIFNAKAHKSLDNLEDGSRIDILRQKVRELQTGHEKSVNGLAKVKALEVKYLADAKSFEDKANEFMDKATKLKARYEAEKDKEVKEQYKSDITLMLTKAESMKQEAIAKRASATTQANIVSNLETKIKEMTSLIKQTKANITNMEARAEAARVNKEISKELSDVNFDGVSAQIEEIEKKITEDNAEAEAWDHIDTALQDDEERINKMLSEPTGKENSALFDDFMKSK
jgi:phage shock protein A